MKTFNRKVKKLMQSLVPDTFLKLHGFLLIYLLSCIRYKTLNSVSISSTPLSHWIPSFGCGTKDCNKTRLSYHDNEMLLVVLGMRRSNITSERRTRLDTRLIGSSENKN
jgi:hypothetical protein